MLDFIKLAQQAKILDNAGKYESADAILLKLAQEDRLTGNLDLGSLYDLNNKIKAWTAYAQDPMNHPIPSAEYGTPGFDAETQTSTTPAQILANAYRGMFQEIGDLNTSGQFVNVPIFKEAYHNLAYFANQTKPENIGKALPVKQKAKPAPTTPAAPAAPATPATTPGVQQANLPIGNGVATQTSVQAPAQAATPAPSFFSVAKIDPKQYVGNAQQNEALRRVLNSQAPTFYNAYVGKFGVWDKHPSERIQKLSQPSAPQAPAQPKTEQKVAPKAQQQNPNLV